MEAVGGRLSSPLGRGLGAVIATAALAVVLAVVAGGDRIAVPDGPSLPRFTNEAAGYSFAHPEGWTATSEGTASKLTSPGRDLIVSFGLAPAGTLEQVSRKAVAQLSRNYRDAQFFGSEREEIAGRPAFLVAGRGENAAGVPIRFMAIALGGPGGRHVIYVFSAEGADPAEVLPTVEGIVGSFRA
ncbi:MAG: hypothetical protein HY658_03340 [Actinobacteria bacterium]|nr:hypothetical protein [Actinomycetota bacterium]